ncbi:MAG: DUF362 domain-containing protein [Deltaproteobacteria bacterium]|nr:DUF362 domain-containing protein [Deltaproteobacteria bacterium]
MSTVHWVSARREDAPALLEAKALALWDAAGFSTLIQPNDLVAVKVTVGEPGNRTYLTPHVVKGLIREISLGGGRPFLTDTAPLGESARANAASHALVAHRHGFGLGALGAPFVAADGLSGLSEVAVPVRGRHFQEVRVAAAIHEADALLVVAHVTAHLGAGLSGVLKHLGMGCVSRRSKLLIHRAGTPSVVAARCVGCEVCVSSCPRSAVEMVDGRAWIDPERCGSCGDCVSLCRQGAISAPWEAHGEELQERMVEHAAGVVAAKRGRAAFIGVALDLVAECDCAGKRMMPLVEDIGLFAGWDPVAVDLAIQRMVRQRTGDTLERWAHRAGPALVQHRYASSLGMGSEEVELVEVAMR